MLTSKLNKFYFFKNNRHKSTYEVNLMTVFPLGTIEEKIYQRQISKQGLSGAVVDLTKTSEHIQFSAEELRDLFTLHESSHCVTHDLLECECTGELDHTGLLCFNSVTVVKLMCLSSATENV